MLDTDFYGMYDNPRNAPESSLEMLDQARVFAPDAHLYYSMVDADDGADDGADERYEWTGYVAVAELHSEKIVYGAPAEYVEVD